MKTAGLIAVALASAVTVLPARAAGPPSPGASPGPAAASPAAPAAPTQPAASGGAKDTDRTPMVEANKEAAAPDEAANARNAARTRMRECGHQWSGMKKSGAAGTMTWKDFSQGCLARK